MGCGCGCKGMQLDDATRILAGPAAFGCGRTIGDWAPVFTWPSDVDREKQRIGGSWTALDAVVQSCAAVDVATKAAWGADYKNWSDFAQRETPWFGSANEWDLTREWERRLQDWQKKFQGMNCTLTTPIVQIAPEADTSAIKWIAAAIIVAGGVYLLAPVVRPVLARAFK